MGSNSFGKVFTMTTWGESHGPAIGVVVDGCPAGLSLSEGDIQKELQYRQPGQSLYTSARKELDQIEILSGLFDGKTTGAPISVLIRNMDADSSSYEPIKEHLRPGHGQFSYLKKYGQFDWRGGGRASARETASRVIAGSIAKKLLGHFDIELVAYIKAIGGIRAEKIPDENIHQLKSCVRNNAIFCPDDEASLHMQQRIEKAVSDQDSVGGIVELLSSALPIGLGDPIYEKLEARLAFAMLSIPACRGIEFGLGFASSDLLGSENNDLFCVDKGGHITLQTNHAGGILGGISSGQPLILRAAFKPTSTIKKPQKTTTLHGEPSTLHLPPHSRHDPCLAIRAVAVVEAMTALVLADALLINRCAKLEN